MTIAARESAPERWEPPRPGSEKDERQGGRERPRRDTRGAWAAAAFASVGRLSVAVLLGGAGLVALPSTASVAVGVIVELAVFAVTAIAWRAGLPDWGVVWTVDLLTLGLVIPLAVANAFPVSDPGPLLPAEQSLYLETWLAVAAALAVTWAVAWLQTSRAPDSAGLALLPAALAIPAVLSSLGDFRDGPILRALALALVVSGLATALSWAVRPGVRRLVPPAVWLLFVVGVLVPARGATALRAHGTGVALGYLVLLLASAAMVVLGPALVRSLRWRPASRRQGGRHERWQEWTDELPDVYDG